MVYFHGKSHSKMDDDKNRGTPMTSETFIFIHSTRTTPPTSFFIVFILQQAWDQTIYSGFFLKGYFHGICIPDYTWKPLISCPYLSFANWDSWDTKRVNQRNGSHESIDGPMAEEEVSVVVLPLSIRSWFQKERQMCVLNKGKEKGKPDPRLKIQVIQVENHLKI